MEILIKAAQFLLSLSLLIILHEFGHFAFAKLFKTRVEKFYLFFDPWFSLFKYKKGDTEYGIGWLPLGGYVKISGMIDESMDKEQLKKPAQPWEFRAKPTWQRLIIITAGVMVNFLLGFFIYVMVLFTWGEKYMPTDNITDGIWVFDEVVKEIGIKTGDKIVDIDGKKTERLLDLTGDFFVGKTVSVDRNGELIKLDLPVDLVSKLIENKSRLLFYPRMPFIIASISDSSINYNNGLKVRDHIIALNDTPIKYFDEFNDVAIQFKNDTVNLLIERDNETKNISVVLDSAGKIGIMPAMVSLNDMDKMGVYNLVTHDFTFAEAIPAGINKAYNKLNSYVQQVKLILNPKTGAYKGLGGFGTIGNLFPSTWDWQSFWEITAFLSLILAVMNLLPIPGLDGGHTMFIIYEMIFRRKPSDKFMEYAQMAGMLLLFALLIYANGKDIIRAFE
ncbi:MAG: RIP metalloprotease RseP [Bacteroidales bacterium]|nr:RIP metalloprotease RseP [Bacteroidales bacterium]